MLQASWQPQPPPTLPGTSLSSCVYQLQFTPPARSRFRHLEVKRCPLLPYLWQVSLTVSWFGTFSLKPRRPRTQPRHNGRNLPVCCSLPGTRTLTCAQHSLSDGPRRGSGSPPWALAATEAVRYQTAFRMAWKLDLCLRHVRLHHPRVCQPGLPMDPQIPIPADPLGSQGCGKGLPQVRHGSPASLLKLLQQYRGIATVKDWRSTMPTLDCFESEPRARCPCPNAHPVPVIITKDDKAGAV
jgi:hypothetical protein